MEWKVIDAPDLAGPHPSTKQSQLRQRLRRTVFGASFQTILIALAGTIVAFVAYLMSGRVVLQIGFASVSLSLLGLAAALQMARGQRLVDSLASGQLGPWFGTSFAIVFGLASLIWIAPPAPYANLISTGSVLSAMVVVVVALGCFTVGYRIAPRRPVQGGATFLRRVITSRRPVRPGQETAWLLLGIAFVAYLGQIAIGRFGYLSNPAIAVSSGNPLSQLFFVIGNFSVFAAALSANDYARQRGAGRLVSFALLLAAQSIVGAFTGNKEIIALGLFAALFGYATGAQRLPIAALAAAACIFIFVVVPFTTSFRSQVAVGNSRLSPGEVIQAASKRGLAFFLPSQGQSPAIQTLERVSRIGDVAIIVQRTKPSDISYRPITELFEAPFLGLVPRLVWPAKPILDTGYEFSTKYYGFPPSQYTSSAITPEGDLWRHGGWLVLIAGMLLFGGCVRILDAATADVRGAPLCLLIVLTFFPLIVKQETDAVLLLASVPSLLFGVALAAWIVTLRRGGQTRTVGNAVPHVVVAVNKPIQHFSASFRCAARSTHTRFSVLYWADSSGGMFDPEFDRHVSWDVDLLSGYQWLQAKGTNPLLRAVSFIRSIRALNPDMVVCFGWASAAARFTILWCLVSRTPLLFYGDTSWQHTSNGLRRWLRGLLLRTTFRFAAGALSSGTFNREFYIYHGMNPQLIVDSVYPIDVASYAAVREHRRTDTGKRVIGFAGKLITRKGVDELLRALQLISEDPNWEARIIGDGEERQRLEALSETLGIAGRVEFRGFRNASEMPSELAACDIVVVPSFQDNRGMIAAEAMAAGAGVVVSSNTGVWGRGDLVEDGVTGRVYRSGDTAGLATIIRQLLVAPRSLASLQRKGAKRAGKHGPDAFTKALEQAAVTIAAHG